MFRLPVVVAVALHTAGRIKPEKKDIDKVNGVIKVLMNAPYHHAL